MHTCVVTVRNIASVSNLEEKLAVLRAEIRQKLSGLMNVSAVQSVAGLLGKRPATVHTQSPPIKYPRTRATSVGEQESGPSSSGPSNYSGFESSLQCPNPSPPVKVIQDMYQCMSYICTVPHSPSETYPPPPQPIHLLMYMHIHTTHIYSSVIVFTTYM